MLGQESVTAWGYGVGSILHNKLSCYVSEPPEKDSDASLVKDLSLLLELPKLDSFQVVHTQTTAKMEES